MEEKNIKLVELIEQAACTTNMLNLSDTSELNKLQAIIGDIKQNISNAPALSGQILEQAKVSTNDAETVLQKILQNQVDDTSKSIESISKSITVLQGLIEQIEKGTTAVPASTNKTEEQNSESAAKQTMVSEEDVPLVLDFIAESKEHIESAEAGLLQLESKPDDSEVLNMIFRAFHTIKGMAGFLNLTDLGSLAHSAENLLDLARKGELILEGKYTDAVFESIDMLKKMINDLKESIDAKKAVSVQGNLPALLEKLKMLAQGQSLEAVLKTPHGGKRDEKLEDILNKEEPACEKPQEAAKQAESVKVQEPVKSQQEGAKPQEKGPEHELSAEKTDMRGPIPRRSGEERRTDISADEKIKVSTNRLDNLINMTGELVIAQLMIREEANTKLSTEYELNRKVAHQGKIIRELQELSMSMRMVPIEGVFQKMARLVRDLSHKADKKINFVTKGEETELDRNIVDKIADPLVHMVRNSVDHGIESAEERAKSGKNPAGKIELRAFHQAGNIVIEIEDDGKGLNKDRILKKAIESGVVEAGQQLSEDEIFKLIFHAGLSTAEKVTSISGRGVGMDVVKKNVESLRGKIEISSMPGRGSIFTIRLPLTLAIIDGQIIRVGQERYIVPINSIVRTLKPEKSQLSSVQNKGEMVIVRGQMLPMIRLYELFNTKPVTEDPTKGLLVIVEEESKKCGLMVDELLGQQQIVIKSLGDGLGIVKGVSGGAIMGDGMVSLILDIPGIMALAQG